MKRAMWTAGAPLRWLSVGVISFYRMTLSGVLGGRCRFYPSCSVYAEEAIRARGFVRGWTLAVWRVARCNPFGKGGYEPVPAAHDGVIHERPREVAWPRSTTSSRTTR
jgi:putative membrane protein insertion efficiency factor